MRPRSFPRGLELGCVRGRLVTTEQEKPAQARAEEGDAVAEVVSVASHRPKMFDTAGVTTDADATDPGGRLPWDRGTRDILRMFRFASRLPPCMTPRQSQQRRRRQIRRFWSRHGSFLSDVVFGRSQP